MTLYSVEMDMNEAGVNRNIVVAQITDLHLLADRESELMGYCTYSMLSDTVDAILEHDTRPDVCLLTGDISQDESVESYELARFELERLGIPVFWIPGNHDERGGAETVFGASENIRRLTKLVTADWDFIYLDTCRQGAGEGYLNDRDFERFVSEVEASTGGGKNIAVVMHHHPVPTQTPLLDGYMLLDNERLLKTLDDHRQVKLVICGHVHGDYRIRYGNQMIEMCPATCFQWEKGTSTMTTENWRGFRVFEFSPSGYRSALILV
ncbi:metallophosphoesterase [Ralstonia solanacearum]|uniref:metallophosphoesterase n=1 Tax=Ralstonia solanacearum TaxID=305 RepID=UPI001E32077E|nr:metallophosphoesterase [Ralstonia solanacearum]